MPPSPEVAERADLLAVPLRRVRLRRILVDGDAVLVGDGAQRGHVRRVAVEVHRLDALGARRDRGLDGDRVDAEVVRLDVDEHRRGAGEGDGVGGGGEGEGRDDHLVAGADARGQQAEVRARGAGVHGHAGPAAGDLVAKLLLERRDLGAARDHAGAQDAVDRLALLVTDERLRCGDHAWASVRVSSFST